MRYKSIAQRLVAASYALDTKSAFTISDLLVSCGIEDDLDQILVDDDVKRTQRLGSLTLAIRVELALHDRRRMRAPLVESELAPGSFLYCFADDSSLDAMERDLRARFRLLPQMLASMHELTPVQFEVLCGRLMHTLGCRNVKITQAQKDDGVDVVAGLPITAAIDVESGNGLPAFFRVVGALSFLIYGQAKRYSESHKVNQEAVFELEGSWRSTRNAYFEGTLAKERQEALRDVGYRFADPVLLLLMTTSSFTRGALDKGDVLGMILLDGEQIAQMMLQLGLGISAVATARYETSVALLLLSLESCSPAPLDPPR